MGEHLMFVKQMLFFDTDGNNVSFCVNVGRTWGEFCLSKNGGSKGTGSWREKRAIPVLPKLQHPFRRTSKDLSDLLFRKAACQLRTSLGMMLWLRFPKCVVWGWSDTVRSVCMETSCLQVRLAQLQLVALTQKERRCYLVSPVGQGVSLRHLTATPHSKMQFHSHSGLV